MSKNFCSVVPTVEDYAATKNLFSGYSAFEVAFLRNYYLETNPSVFENLAEGATIYTQLQELVREAKNDKSLQRKLNACQEITSKSVVMQRAINRIGDSYTYTRVVNLITALLKDRFYSFQKQQLADPNTKITRPSDLSITEWIINFGFDANLVDIISKLDINNSDLNAALDEELAMLDQFSFGLDVESKKKDLRETYRKRSNLASVINKLSTEEGKEIMLGVKAGVIQTLQKDLKIKLDTFKVAIDFDNFNLEDGFTYVEEASNREHWQEVVEKKNPIELASAEVRRFLSSIIHYSKAEGTTIFDVNGVNTYWNDSEAFNFIKAALSSKISLDDPVQSLISALDTEAISARRDVSALFNEITSALRSDSTLAQYFVKAFSLSHNNYDEISINSRRFGGRVINYFQSKRLANNSSNVYRHLNNINTQSIQYDTTSTNKQLKINPHQIFSILHKNIKGISLQEAKDLDAVFDKLEQYLISINKASNEEERDFLQKEYYSYLNREGITLAKQAYKSICEIFALNYNSMDIQSEADIKTVKAAITSLKNILIESEESSTIPVKHATNIVSSLMEFSDRAKSSRVKYGDSVFDENTLTNKYLSTVDKYKQFNFRISTIESSNESEAVKIAKYRQLITEIRQHLIKEYLESSAYVACEKIGSNIQYISQSMPLWIRNIYDALPLETEGITKESINNLKETLDSFQHYVLKGSSFNNVTINTEDFSKNRDLMNYLIQYNSHATLRKIPMVTMGDSDALRFITAKEIDCFDEINVTSSLTNASGVISTIDLEIANILLYEARRMKQYENFNSIKEDHNLPHEDQYYLMDFANIDVVDDVEEGGLLNAEKITLKDKIAKLITINLAKNTDYSTNNFTDLLNTIALDVNKLRQDENSDLAKELYSIVDATKNNYIFQNKELSSNIYEILNIPPTMAQEETIDNFLLSFALNTKVHIANQLLFLGSDPAIFKNQVEQQKRIKAENAPGDPIYSSFVDFDGNDLFNGRKEQHYIVLKDINYKFNSDTEGIPDEHFVTLLKGIKTNPSDPSSKSLYDLYYKDDSVKATDGGAYRNAKSWRDMQIAMGNSTWTREKDRIFMAIHDFSQKYFRTRDENNNIIGIKESVGDEAIDFVIEGVINEKVKTLDDFRKIINRLFDKYQIVLQPQKPHTTSIERVKLNGSDIIHIPVEHKYAEVIIMPEFLPINSTRSKLALMMENGLDLAIYSSGVKYGNFGATSINEITSRTSEELATYYNTDLKDDSERGEYDAPTYLRHKVAWEDVRIQTNVPLHLSQEQLFGTQIRKHMFTILNRFVFNIKEADGVSNALVESINNKKALFIDKILKNESNEALQSLYNKYKEKNKITEELTVEQKTEAVLSNTKAMLDFISSLNASERAYLYNKVVCDNFFKKTLELKSLFDNTSEFQNYLEKHVERDSNTTLEDLLCLSTVFEENSESASFNIPLFEGSRSYDRETAICSLYKSLINKQKIRGGSAVQMINYAQDEAGEDLKCHYRFNSKGEPVNIDYVECAKVWDLKVTINGKEVELDFDQYCDSEGNLKMSDVEITKESNPELYNRYEYLKDENGKVYQPLVEKDFFGILDLIAYRIPTENLYSVLNLRVKRFTRKCMGGTIQVPPQYIKVAGWDFDIDKLYFFQRECTYSKKINYAMFKNDIAEEYANSKKEAFDAFIKSQLAEDISEEEKQKRKINYKVFAYVYTLFPKLYDIAKLDRDNAATSSSVKKKEPIYGYFEELLKDIAQELQENNGDVSKLSKEFRDILTSSNKFALFDSKGNFISDIHEYYNYAFSKMMAMYNEFYAGIHAANGQKDRRKANTYYDIIREFVPNKQDQKYYFNQGAAATSELPAMFLQHDEVEFLKSLEENGENKYQSYLQKFREYNEEVYRELSQKLINYVEYTDKSTVNFGKSFLDQSDASRNNLLFDLMQTTLSDPQTLHQRYVPGGFDGIALEADRAKQMLKLESSSSAFSRQQDKNKCATNILTICEFNERNRVAKKIVGIMANHNTNAVYCRNLSQFTLKDEHKITLFGRTFNNLNSEEGVNLLAQFLAASVDAVKNPVLNFLNINAFTANTACTMARLGMNIHTINSFLNQPIIRKLYSLSLDHNTQSTYTLLKRLFEQYDILKAEHEKALKNKSTSSFMSEEEATRYIEELNGADFDSYMISANDSQKAEFIKKQMAVLVEFEKLHKVAQSLGAFIRATKFTASNAVENNFGGVYASMNNIRSIADEDAYNTLKIFNFGLQEDMPIRISKNIEDALDPTSQNEYITRNYYENPLGVEQVAFDTFQLFIKSIEKYFPYETPIYKNLRNILFDISEKNLSDEDVQNLHSFITRSLIENFQYDGTLNFFKSSQTLYTDEYSTANAEAYFKECVPVLVGTLLNYINKLEYEMYNTPSIYFTSFSDRIAKLQEQLNQEDFDVFDTELGSCFPKNINLVDDPYLFKFIARNLVSLLDNYTLEELLNNDLLRSMTTTSDYYNQGALRLSLSGKNFDKAVKDLLSYSWANLVKNIEVESEGIKQRLPDLSDLLFYYCYHQKGFEISPFSFINLVPTAVINNLTVGDNKYVDVLNTILKGAFKGESSDTSVTLLESLPLSSILCSYLLKNKNNSRICHMHYPVISSRDTNSVSYSQLNLRDIDSPQTITFTINNSTEVKSNDADNEITNLLLKRQIIDAQHVNGKIECRPFFKATISAGPNTNVSGYFILSTLLSPKVEDITDAKINVLNIPNLREYKIDYLFIPESELDHFDSFEIKNAQSEGESPSTIKTNLKTLVDEYLKQKQLQSQQEKEKDNRCS